MKYSQERKPSAFGELSRAAELRPKQAVLARLALPHQWTVKDVAAELVESAGSVPSRSSPGEGPVSPRRTGLPRAAGRRRRHVA